MDTDKLSWNIYQKRKTLNQAVCFRVEDNKQSRNIILDIRDWKAGMKWCQRIKMNVEMNASEKGKSRTIWNKMICHCVPLPVFIALKKGLWGSNWNIQETFVGVLTKCCGGERSKALMIKWSAEADDCC